MEWSCGLQHGGCGLWASTLKTRLQISSVFFLFVDPSHLATLSHSLFQKTTDYISLKMASSQALQQGGSRRFISMYPDVALDRAALEIEFRSSIIQNAEQDKMIEDATSMAEDKMTNFIGEFTSCDEDCSMLLNEFHSYVRQTLEESRILQMAEVYASLHAYTRSVNTFGHAAMLDHQII
jgi:hypothetical protein